VSVLTIVNQLDAGPGLFADEAAARGVDLREWVAAAGPPPRGPWDGVLVLGGAMHVDQTERHPWMRDVLGVVEAALSESVPTLGVCLGGQMLALVAGGEVGPAREPENGWKEIVLRPEARADALLRSFDGERIVTFQGHSYAFSTPPGGVTLADTDVCEQAFRLGDSAWGIQFHPEATVPMLELWIGHMDLDDQTRPDVIEETRRRAAYAKTLASTLFGRFLDVVDARAPRPS
jgi:GMP synthase-like glutamine amidotransferase